MRPLDNGFVRVGVLAACVLLLAGARCEIVSLATEGVRVRIETGLLLAVGDTMTVSYRVLDGESPIHSSQWSSRDPEIAEFVAPRRLLGRSPGETVITVRVRTQDGERGSDQARVTVRAAD